MARRHRLCDRGRTPGEVQHDQRVCPVRPQPCRPETCGPQGERATGRHPLGLEAILLPKPSQTVRERMAGEKMLNLDAFVHAGNTDSFLDIVRYARTGSVSASAHVW